jgi:hypothetical protein
MNRRVVKSKRFDPPAALKWLLLGFAVATLVALLRVSSAYAEDVDEDGLDDAMEQALINAHAPRLFYDSGETYWPSSVTWKVRHSELLYDTTEHVIYTKDELNTNTMLILSGRHNGWVSSTEYKPYYPPDNPFRLNIYDEFRGGSYPADEPLGVGMYARVVPLTGPITCPNYPALSVLVWAGDLLIQYYQFFPYDYYYGGPDHEGDWLFLDVYVSGTDTNILKAIVYHHQGDGKCGPSLLTGGELPPNGEPQCYLEHGAHEWWPTDGGTAEGCWFSKSHNGNGPSIRPANVINIGEHFAPMNNDEAKMIVYYNGSWGYGTAGMEESPPGPLSLRSDRCFCVQAPRFVAYVASGYTPPRDEVKASKDFPVGTVSEGVAVISANSIVSTNGHVRIAPGSYPEPMTITTPMTLEVWSAWGPGTVTIGP